MHPAQKAPRYLILAIILLTGLLLRTEGLKWGIPKAPYWRSYHPDERVVFSTLLKMTTSDGELNPHYFVNPTFHYYSIGLVWWAAKTIKAVPSFRDIIDESPSVTLDDVTRIWLMARSVSVVMGLLTILVVYLLAREFFKNEVFALAGAWLTAVMPTLVIQSHYMTVDGPVGFWFLLAMLLILKSFRQDRVLIWAGAGLLSGLAVATKYNAIVGLASVFVLLLARQRFSNDGKADKIGYKVILFTGAMLLGFLLGCPHALISFGEWKEGIRGLLYYNDFATDWFYPWLVTSRLSLGWPGWILFMVSSVAIFVKPDRTGTILAAGILPYFLMYGYKASPFMRHMVLIIPLMLLLVIYSMDKTLRYLDKGIFKVILAVLVLLTSGYAMANSLAWLRVMSGKDTREEAAEFVKQTMPRGSPVGLAGKSWFYTPPLEENEYDLVRLEYNPNRLEQFYPPMIIISEYESKQFAFCRESPEVRDRFFEMLGERYKGKKIFNRIPRCCGIKFSGYPLADWNYFYPEITIYERSFR